MTRLVGEYTSAILHRVIAMQETPEARAEFARIAHADGHLTDQELAEYERFAA